MTDDSAGDADGGVRRERGATAIYAALREDILTLRLAPGSAVDEVGIARQFGMSRTPVREALVMLSGEGLVRFLPNRSSIVSPLSMENLNDYFDTLLILTRAIMVAAAVRRQPGDGDTLRGLLAAFTASIDQPDRFATVLAQLDLLKGFSAVARNKFLGQFFPTCLDYGRRTLLLHYFPYAQNTDLHALAADYDRLIAAVEGGDAAACNRIAGEQIGAVVRVVQRSLGPVFADAVDLTAPAFPAFPALAAARPPRR